jgi:hypothetical protein
MRRVIAIITLSELHKQRGEYPPWELPILEEVHKGQIEVIGEMRCGLSVPHPEDEYSRLERRFSRNKETGIPYVAQIYGSGSIGVQNLATAMADDLAEQAELDREAAGIEAVAGSDVDPTPAAPAKAKRKATRKGK